MPGVDSGTNGPSTLSWMYCATFLASGRGCMTPCRSGSTDDGACMSGEPVGWSNAASGDVEPVEHVVNPDADAVVTCVTAYVTT